MPYSHLWQTFHWGQRSPKVSLSISWLRCYEKKYQAKIATQIIMNRAPDFATSWWIYSAKSKCHLKRLQEHSMVDEDMYIGWVWFHIFQLWAIFALIRFTFSPDIPISLAICSQVKVFKTPQKLFHFLLPIHFLCDICIQINMNDLYW